MESISCGIAKGARTLLCVNVMQNVEGAHALIRQGISILTPHSKQKAEV